MAHMVMMRLSRCFREMNMRKVHEFRDATNIKDSEALYVKVAVLPDGPRMEQR